VIDGQTDSDRIGVVFLSGFNNFGQLWRNINLIRKLEIKIMSKSNALDNDVWKKEAKQRKEKN